MRRCPALESSWVRAYEVMPWMSVASSTAPTIQGRIAWSWWVKTLSIRDLRSREHQGAGAVDDHQEEAAEQAGSGAAG